MRIAAPWAVLLFFALLTTVDGEENEEIQRTDNEDDSMTVEYLYVLFPKKEPRPYIPTILVPFLAPSPHPRALAFFLPSPLATWVQEHNPFDEPNARPPFDTAQFPSIPQKELPPIPRQIAHDIQKKVDVAMQALLKTTIIPKQRRVSQPPAPTTTEEPEPASQPQVDAVEEEIRQNANRQTIAKAQTGEESMYEENEVIQHEIKKKKRKTHKRTEEHIVRILPVANDPQTTALLYKNEPKSVDPTSVSQPLPTDLKTKKKKRTHRKKHKKSEQLEASQMGVLNRESEPISPFQFTGGNEISETSESVNQFTPTTEPFSSPPTRRRFTRLPIYRNAATLSPLLTPEERAYYENRNFQHQFTNEGMADIAVPQTDISSRFIPEGMGDPVMIRPRYVTPPMFEEDEEQDSPPKKMRKLKKKRKHLEDTILTETVNGGAVMTSKSGPTKLQPAVFMNQQPTTERSTTEVVIEQTTAYTVQTTPEEPTTKSTTVIITTSESTTVPTTSSTSTTTETTTEATTTTTTPSTTTQPTTIPTTTTPSTTTEEPVTTSKPEVMQPEENRSTQFQVPANPIENEIISQIMHELNKKSTQKPEDADYSMESELLDILRKTESTPIPTTPITTTEATTTKTHKKSKKQRMRGVASADATEGAATIRPDELQRKLEEIINMLATKDAGATTKSLMESVTDRPRTTSFGGEIIQEVDGEDETDLRIQPATPAPKKSKRKERKGRKLNTIAPAQADDFVTSRPVVRILPIGATMTTKQSILKYAPTTVAPVVAPAFVGRDEDDENRAALRRQQSQQQQFLAQQRVQENQMQAAPSPPQSPPTMNVEVPGEEGSRAVSYGRARQYSQSQASSIPQTGNPPPAMTVLSQDNPQPSALPSAQKSFTPVQSSLPSVEARPVSESLRQEGEYLVKTRVNEYVVKGDVPANFEAVLDKHTARDDLTEEARRQEQFERQQQQISAQQLQLQRTQMELEELRQRLAALPQTMQSPQPYPMQRMQQMPEMSQMSQMSQMTQMQQPQMMSGSLQNPLYFNAQMYNPFPYRKYLH